MNLWGLGHFVALAFSPMSQKPFQNSDETIKHVLRSSKTIALVGASHVSTFPLRHNLIMYLRRVQALNCKFFTRNQNEHPIML